MTGPTASGKGRLAVELARRLQTEIVSIDSMKIYRGMDIGTAKPSASLREEFQYHFIDIIDPWQEYSVGEFLPEVFKVIRGLEDRGKPAVLHGGTAFYLNLLLNGLFDGPQKDETIRREIESEIESKGIEAVHAELREKDPEAALKIHLHDKKRIVRALEVIRVTGKPMTEQWEEPTEVLEPGTFRLVGIERDREELYERINLRVLKMVEEGLFQEVRQLMEAPEGLSSTARKCIGYKQVIEGWEAEEEEHVIIERIQRDSRRFAKQQMTWFRKLEIEWLQPGEPQEMVDQILG